METQQIVYNRSLSKICHIANIFYNFCNYLMKRRFLDTNVRLSRRELFQLVRNDKIYSKLPSKTTSFIVRLILHRWNKYFEIYDMTRNIRKMPVYRKKNGEFVVAFDYFDLLLINGFIYFPQKYKLRPVKMYIPYGKNLKIESSNLAFNSSYTFEVFD